MSLALASFVVLAVVAIGLVVALTLLAEAGEDWDFESRRTSRK
jgi:hypothetical protein